MKLQTISTSMKGLEKCFFKVFYAAWVEFSFILCTETPKNNKIKFSF